MARGQGRREPMTRRSIAIDGLTHITAIPVASQVGPLLVSSVIGPFDPGTRNVPAETTAQVENIFRHIGHMLEAAGGTWNDVAKIDFWAPTNEMKAEIDPTWVSHFPDPTSRPARHTHTGGKAITASFMAYITG